MATWKDYLCLIGATAIYGVPTSFAEPVDFNRDVRPLLSRTCFACHGPDAHERKANLRLDQVESATATRDGVTAVVPGAPEKSALIERLFSKDADEVMPPPESRQQLTDNERELLRRWIDEGAVYADHWAFIPPKPIAMPTSEVTLWSHGAVDTFIEARLRQAGLEPGPEAEPSTRLRRLSFDLTGLPVSPEDLALFEAEQAHPNAYERAADRLFASPHYGEHMAVAWMDAARYGDTSVMHADGVRDMWPWRDWVIQAFNENKPFDEFTREQLAGDLMPGATVAQKVASGFNRNHATSDEGGAIPEELRVEYVVDRVKTTANVWLGLTMECSQCHDHKYDPISQREYYQFFAYFNNTTDPGMQSRGGNQAPLVSVLSEAQQRELADIRKRQEAQKQERAMKRAPWVEVALWLDKLNTSPAGELSLGPWRQLGPFKADDPKAAFNRDFGPEKLSEAKALDAPVGDLAWLAGEDSWVDGQAHALDLPDSQALYLARVIESPTIMPVTFSLGSDDSVKAWLNGKALLANEVFRVTAPDQERVDVVLQPGPNLFLMKVVNMTGGSGFYFDPRRTALPEEVAVLAKKDPTALSQAERDQLGEFYSAKIWPEGLAMEQALQEAERAAQAVIAAAPTSMIMEDEREKPRVTYILSRGQYDQPLKDAVVSPGTPSALPAMPAEAARNRLGLAQWLTDPKHPLTARVAVNRWWAAFFGQGLVRTVGDFGNQGEWPSHPELLDWLAGELTRSAWDVKRLQRELVLSATYQQSARLTPEARERDPENRLLSRGPRFRLNGEAVRDQALAVSDLLVDQLGGPGVKPYQPANIWNEVSLDGGLRYARDNGEKLYRRSLYTYWKRSAPMPNMMIFDSPSREKCALERPRTNTPLQALVTLNDPQFVEAARMLAARVLREAETFEARVHRLFRLTTGRWASEKEQQTLKRIAEEQRRGFAGDADRLKAFLEIGEARVDVATEPMELAVWAVLAQMALNLDESLTK